ncbi:MucR family transcriptional regulator [Novosphingobium profundi]|uniref:MucR family transcriptional regulator n=1 Tax=Novosphingobium profundi TaxID=1774954 RepID=UPI001BDAE7D9|nr:MucR family transcriptional regulator [Novosphingobium profundi]MBT0667409.1 MucR family transcriptional regulator [Novosphingobium profundi]
MTEIDNSGVMSLTVTLLSAYFANNTVPSNELPALVEGTRRALLGGTSIVEDVSTTAVAKRENAPQVTPVADEVVTPPPASAHDYVPAVSIEESLASPDEIVSLIDGKPYKTLKRHLSSRGMTPAEYRARYKLPADYPLVAPSYSQARREVARKSGLGGNRKAASAPAPTLEAAPIEAPISSQEGVWSGAPATKAASRRRTPAKASAPEQQASTSKPKRAAARTNAGKTAAGGAAPTAKGNAAKPKRKASKTAASSLPAAEAVDVKEASTPKRGRNRKSAAKPASTSAMPLQEEVPSQ